MSSKPSKPPTLPSVAGSTESGKNVAMAQFSRFTHSNDLPSSDGILPNTNYEELLSAFAMWMLYQDKNTGEKYAAPTVEEYVGRIKEILKNKDPTWAAWKTEDQWYSRLKTSLKGILNEYRSMITMKTWILFQFID